MENALKIFNNSVPKESHFKKAYEIFINQILKNQQEIPRQKSILVARTIHKILENQKPKARVIVPLASFPYEILSRFCPVALQDLFVRIKFKFLNKTI